MAEIFYHAVPADWTREEKLRYLAKTGTLGDVAWTDIVPNKKHQWLTGDLAPEFDGFLPIGSKEAKQSASSPAVFRTYCRGVCSNSDAYVYSFDFESLTKRAEAMVDNYNSELERWRKKGQPKNVEAFVKVDAHALKWVRRTKKELARGSEIAFHESRLRTALYRPFTQLAYYFEPGFNEDVYQWPHFLPDQKAEKENRVIVLSDAGLRSPFSVLMTNHITDLHLCATTDAFQCFPFYTYDGADGARRENIPLSTLVSFQQHYGDEAITKWDIFHYAYAVLHHPEYRTRYAANLRRELPRLPLVGAFWDGIDGIKKIDGKKKKSARFEDNPVNPVNPVQNSSVFQAFAEIGKRLADLHVHYEQAAEHPLQRIEAAGEPLNWRVEKMRLTKDKTALVYNDFLTLAGIPEAAYTYRLGNRSALEWVIDQYQTHTDPRSGITNDPNREDEPDYIVKLIGKVITVSLETQKLIAALPKLTLP